MTQSKLDGVVLDAHAFLVDAVYFSSWIIVLSIATTSYVHVKTNG